MVIIDSETFIIEADEDTRRVHDFITGYSRWCVVDLSYTKTLIAHGDETGRLSIADEMLEATLHVQGIKRIICCYPRQVREFYRPFFPEVTPLVFWPALDTPIELTIQYGAEHHTLTLNARTVSR